MLSVFILGAVFLGVTLLVVAIAMLMRDKTVSQMEGRLSTLTGKGDRLEGAAELFQILAKERGAGRGFLESLVSRWFNLPRLFSQADVHLSVTKFVAISGALGFATFLGSGMLGIHYAFAPFIGLAFAMLPLGWLMFLRKKRLKKFAAQLPEALELVARALRAGHSLASGFRLVSSEMSEPIGQEFGRVFEEQNLGIPFEEALDTLTERVPNLDLKFFATAVILQRQTGGDLAEILDKIGTLVRERFKIFGQVQALTGEGRLSGVVLLALPPLLFVVVYRMNPEYMKVLFTDELGKKMLIGGVLLQLVGALVIRKIVNIRV